MCIRDRDKASEDVNQSGMIYLAHGVFYSTKTNSDDETEVTIYTRNGKREVGVATVTDGMVADKDGTRIYVDLKGALQTETAEDVYQRQIFCCVRVQDLLQRENARFTSTKSNTEILPHKTAKTSIKSRFSRATSIL